MSYGDATPISSSDDDDNQGTQDMNHTASGFTETHLDATPVSDADSNDIDINPDNHFYVRVHYEGHLETFEVSQHDTLQDLRNRMSSRDSMQMSECHHFLRRSNDGLNDQDEDEDEDIDDLIQSGRLLLDESAKAHKFNGDTLSIYWKSFTLNIVDGMDLSLNMRVSQDWTIKKLKDEVKRIHSVALHCLSYSGMELVDERQLQYYNITKSGFTVVYRISITIEDPNCSISSDLLVCDFWDFDAVLRAYLEKERREPHQNGHFYHSGNKISLLEQVYALNLTNRSRLEYRVDAYPIFIYDSESALQQNDLNALCLEVFDSWTLTDVKKAYSRMTKKPFMEKEKFLSQERELEDNVPLWKLRIRDNEKLIIEREQQEAMVSYICCECGHIVNLRRYDSVQCRQCFHGAVYKQRTGRVCQYDCR